MQITAMTMGVSTTAAIAYHRYSLLANQTPTASALNMAPLAVTWLASIMTATPMLYIQTIVPVKDNLLDVVLFDQCVEVWGVNWGKPALTIIMLILHHVVPCLVIAYFHVKIVKLINKDKKFKKSPLMKNQENQRTRKTTILLVTVTVVFLASWLPFHIFHLIRDYWGIFENDPQKLYIAFAGVHVAAMSSTLWNALLYGVLNDNLKAGIIDSFSSAKTRRRRLSQRAVSLDRKERAKNISNGHHNQNGKSDVTEV